ncbi:MAG: TRAP transporter small permease subunit [Deltaproteobacteria bacterium]|nr:TRAP transporter small permease subunit [Candidatus Anaeroferrophillacea bacterium]
MSLLKRISQFIDLFNEWIGLGVSWLTTIMVLNVFYDVVMRYVFKQGNIALQELEWHLFAVIFLIGAAYALKKDAHVRVDIVYTRLSTRQKAWIDFLGTIVFLIPYSLMVIYASRGFVASSWSLGEISPDPGGLPARYILKAMIPIGFSLVILQGISQAIKNFLVIIGREPEVGDYTGAAPVAGEEVK